MIFGVTIEASDEFPAGTARLNLNHYEAFSLLVVWIHGHGAEPKKRMRRSEFDDRLASYGIDPDDPNYKKALRSLRRKKTMNRGALPILELNLAGGISAHALRRNSTVLDVIHPLPVIEALAATLRYADQHTIYANSSVTGGIPVTDLNSLASASLRKADPEFAATLPDGLISPEMQEKNLEGLLGMGLLFMYDGHVYAIYPGRLSEYDDEFEAAA